MMTSSSSEYDKHKADDANTSGGLFDAPFVSSETNSRNVDPNFRNHGFLDNDNRGLHETQLIDDNDQNMFLIPRSSNNVASSGASSNHPALRRRENDSFASPTYSNNNYYYTTNEPQHQYFTSDASRINSSATTGIAASRFESGSVIPGLFQQNRKRFLRKHNASSNDNHQLSPQDRWIKLAMKGVLLSPVIVLGVWSIAAVVFTHKQVVHSSSSNSTSQSSNTNSNGNRKAMVAERRQQQQVSFARKNWFGRNNKQQQQQYENEPLYQRTLDDYSNGLFPVSPVARGASEEVKYETPFLVESKTRGSRNGIPLIVQPPNLFPNAALVGGMTNEEVQQQLLGQAQIVNPDLFATLYPGRMGSQLQEQDPYYQQQQPLLGHVNAYYNSFKKGSSQGQDTVFLQQMVPAPLQQRQASSFSRGTGMIGQLFARRNNQMQPQLHYYGNSNSNVVQPYQYDSYSQQQPRPYGYNAGMDDPMLANHPAMGESLNVADEQLLGRSAVDNYHRTNYLRGGNNIQNKDKVQYYFYDPHSVTRNRDTGEISIPTTVYDVSGRPVLFDSVSSSAKEIYMEPPKKGSSSSSSGSSKYYYVQSSNTSNTTYSPSTVAPTSTDNATTTNVTTWVHPNVVHTPVYDRHKQMSYQMSPSDLAKAVGNGVPDWGDSTSSDSTIIICTVGIMALLVGAISARRMRSRSLLSMCIENESLEDDAAYDAAYTIPATAGGVLGDNQYHTFGSSTRNHLGWKGDLEKFDV